MTTRGIRRKKSTYSEVKIAIIGAPGVGKSALTVRFITRRYIGEYDHQTENKYKYEVLVDGDTVLIELLDTCPKNEHDLPNATEITQWADGLLLVYSLTDRNSFNYIRKVKTHLYADIPVALIANKNDMVHLRQISQEEGEILAKDFDCKYIEVSAAEQIQEIADVFHELCKDILASRRKSKQSLLERMLGSTRPYIRGKSDSALPKD